MWPLEVPSNPSWPWRLASAVPCSPPRDRGWGSLLSAARQRKPLPLAPGHKRSRPELSPAQPAPPRVRLRAGHETRALLLRHRGSAPVQSFPGHFALLQDGCRGFARVSRCLVRELRGADGGGRTMEHITTPKVRSPRQLLPRHGPRLGHGPGSLSPLPRLQESLRAAPVLGAFQLSSGLRPLLPRPAPRPGWEAGPGPGPGPPLACSTFPKRARVRDARHGHPRALLRLPDSARQKGKCALTLRFRDLSKSDSGIQIVAVWVERKRQLGLIGNESRLPCPLDPYGYDLDCLKAPIA